MPFDFGISSITFSDGTSVDLPPVGVTAIVGPNNTGKTTSLRDIRDFLATDPQYRRMKVVTEVEIRKSGDEADVREWIERNCARIPNQHGVQVTRMGVNTDERTLISNWTHEREAYMGQWSHLLVLLADIDSRAGLASGSAPADYLHSPPSTPVHFLYASGELEQRISGIAYDNFGTRLTLQRLGEQRRLLVGTPDADVPPINRPTREYALAEASLETVESQGHGIRSFIGLALVMIVQHYPVVLIDEPEAFLHPPQRRALGRLVGRLAQESGSQVIVATHDTEILWGLLDGSPSVKVIRLTREGGVNRAQQIDTDETLELWKDPLLRYSRVFDGLFYEKVVVCESESDCRFYAAVTDHLVEQGRLSRPDALFASVGGKDRVPVVVSALRGLSVDVRAVLDFDAIRDSSLERLVDAAGGNWDEVNDLRRRVAEGVSQRRVAKPILGLRDEIGSLLKEKSGYLDRELSRALIQACGHKDGWDDAKALGVNGVPAGDLTTNCVQLLDRLESLGIFVSRHGELESFVRAVGGHGPRWVNGVLASSLHQTAIEAHDFVLRFLESA